MRWKRAGQNCPSEHRRDEKSGSSPDLDRKPKGVCAVGPIGFVSDLIARRDAPSGTILETEIRKPVRSGVADVDFRNAVAFRTHARIEPDGGGVDAGVSAFLELAESIPTQAERVNQARIE